MRDDRTSEITIAATAPTLDARARQADAIDWLRKRDLQPGDWVLVTTKNSVYSIYVIGDGRYRISGGWFDRKGRSPEEITINGCTWGGSGIKQDVVAARGLFLEFGNGVLTTRIRDVMVIHHNDQPVVN